MNKAFNDKLYYPLSLALLGFTSLLNASPKLIVCACVYVMLALTANSITELYGKKEAVVSILLAILASLAFTAKTIDLILIGSFFSVLISTYCGITLFTKLKVRTSNFHTRNFIALITASMIDSIIMPSVLLMKFPVAKCLSIALNDMMYKGLYSIAIALSLVGISYLMKYGRKIMYISE